MIEVNEASGSRRAAILDAAMEVFLRYGFKKTSMDDVARAAGLSRQGLYLHFFSTKDALFRGGVRRYLDVTRAAGRGALARAERPVEERVLEMFVAIHGAYIGQVGEHMNELMLTASELLGSDLGYVEREQSADLAGLLLREGVAAAWKSAGLSAKQMAEHLFAASLGLKHRVASVADYRAQMRVAVRIVCRGQAL